MKLNHDAKSLSGALGISDERHRYIHSLIWWSLIHQYHMKEKLYDKSDRNDVPEELCTKSGILEYIFNHLSTEQERLLAVYDFQKVDFLTDEDEKSKMTLSALYLKAEMLDWDKEAFIEFFSEKMLEASEASEA